MEAVSRRSSSSGMCSIWKHRAGPPRSRASSAVAAASPPPALAPSRARRSVSTPSSLGVVEEESQGAVTIVQPGGERVLGGEAVLDRDHDRTGPDGRRGGAGVLGLDAADDEAPTVDQQHRRARARGRSGAGRPARRRRDRPPSRARTGPRSRASRCRGPRPGVAASIASNPARAATGSDRSMTGSSSSTAVELRVDHGALSPAVSVDYLGCMRMPASMRIDSAFMYELDSSSRASVANSVACPSRCGNRTSWASLALNALGSSAEP